MEVIGAQFLPVGGAPCRRKELRNQGSIGVHAAADVHHEDHPGIGPPGFLELELQLTKGLCRGVDGASEIKLIRALITTEGAQLAECHLHLPHVENEIAAIAAIPPRVHGPHEATPSTPGGALAGPQTDAAGVVTPRAKGRRAAGADPVTAPIVTLLLLFHALFEHAFQLFDVDFFERRPVFFREFPAGHGVLQPSFEII